MAGAQLLIVEDHPLYRDGFAAMAAALRPHWTLHFVDTVDAAMGASVHSNFDAAIVDVGLRGEDGIELAARLRAAVPDLPILMMSGRNEPSLERRAERAGAAGFVLKDGSADDMAAAVDRVLAGGRAFAASGCGTALPQLTSRQAEVLALLAEGHANKEIRHRLGIAERTVRAHLTELFVALGASSRTHALVRARALGLLD